MRRAKNTIQRLQLLHSLNLRTTQSLPSINHNARRRCFTTTTIYASSQKYCRTTPLIQSSSIHHDGLTPNETFFFSRNHPSSFHISKCSTFSTDTFSSFPPSSSSPVNTATRSLSSFQKYELATHKLLDLQTFPIGSFTQGTLREIISILEGWTNFSVNENESVPVNNDKSYNAVVLAGRRALELLERVFQEEEQHWNKIHSPNSKSWRVPPEMYELTIKALTRHTTHIHVHTHATNNKLEKHDSWLEKSISILDRMESSFLPTYNLAEGGGSNVKRYVLYSYIHILNALMKYHHWDNHPDTTPPIATNILQRMKTQQERFLHHHIYHARLDTMTTNIELNLHAMLGDAIKAEQTFYAAQALEQNENIALLDASSYAVLMKAWIQSFINSDYSTHHLNIGNISGPSGGSSSHGTNNSNGDEKMADHDAHENLIETAGQKCEDLLLQMIKQSKSDEKNHHLKPDIMCFTTAIRAWAISHNLEAAHKAHTILTWMEESDVKPNTISYNTAIDAYAHAHCEKGGGGLGAEQAEQLLFRMVEAFGKGEINAKPDIISFNTVLKGWTFSRKNVDCGNRAEAILNWMEQLQDKDDLDISVQPDSLSYNSVIHAHSVSRHIDAHHRAESIHSRMKERNIKLSRLGYTSLIRAWVGSEEEGSSRIAENYINEMEQQYKDGVDLSMKPEHFVYTMVCDAYAQEGDVKKAFEIYERIVTAYENGEEDMKPSVYNYTTLLNALANSNDREAANKAQIVLDKLLSLRFDENKDIPIEPQLFNAMMKVWLKSNDKRAADKVLQLLQYMETLSKEGYIDAKPNLITYNTVIATLARSRSSGAAFKAEAILDVMMSMSKEEEGGEPDLSPDTVTFSSVIHALSMCGEQGAAEKAEDLLLRMEEEYRNGNHKVKPNTHTFTSVITAHTSKRTTEGAERAEFILNRMEETEGMIVKPNNITYSAVIDAWAKSGDKNAWKRANAILERMKKKSEMGNTYLTPNIVPYTSVLNALARSREKGKARKAVNMLRKIAKNPNTKPNLYTYNAVLSAATFTYGDPNEMNEALHIALMILEEGLHQAQPHDRTNVTYGLFIQACHNLSRHNPLRVEKVLDAVFTRCCQDGQVDRPLVSMFCKIATPLLLEKHFGAEARMKNGDVDFRTCPSSWSRNVTQRTNRRKLREHT